MLLGFGKELNGSHIRLPEIMHVLNCQTKIRQIRRHSSHNSVNRLSIREIWSFSKLVLETNFSKNICIETYFTSIYAWQFLVANEALYYSHYYFNLINISNDVKLSENYKYKVIVHTLLTVLTNIIMRPLYISYSTNVCLTITYRTIQCWIMQELFQLQCTDNKEELCNRRPEPDCLCDRLWLLLYLFLQKEGKGGHV